MAAAVAFYGLLSFVPLVLVAVWALATWQGDSALAQDRVFSFLDRMLPVERETLRDLVRNLLEQRGAIGLTGLAGLLLTSIGGFSTLESAINVIWSTPRRNVLMNKVFALAMLLVLGVLMLASILLTAAVQWAGALPFLGWLNRPEIVALLGPTVSIALSSTVFVLVYKWFPNRPIRWRPAVISGVIVAVLWEATKTIYAYYTAQFANFGAAYGAMGGFVGLILWIYYSSMLLLLGAEFSWLLAGSPKGPTESMQTEPTK
jgi:membrane protein